jgi:hypothetical protein
MNGFVDFVLLNTTPPAEETLAGSGEFIGRENKPLFNVGGMGII